MKKEQKMGELEYLKRELKASAERRREYKRVGADEQEMREAANYSDLVERIGYFGEIELKEELRKELKASAERRRQYKEIGAYEQEAAEIANYSAIVEKMNELGKKTRVSTPTNSKSISYSEAEKIRYFHDQKDEEYSKFGGNREIVEAKKLGKYTGRQEIAEDPVNNLDNDKHEETKKEGKIKMAMKAVGVRLKRLPAKIGSAILVMGKNVFAMIKSGQEELKQEIQDDIEEIGTIEIQDDIKETVTMDSEIKPQFEPKLEEMRRNREQKRAERGIDFSKKIEDMKKAAKVACPKRQAWELPSETKREINANHSNVVKQTLENNRKEKTIQDKGRVVGDN